jgi:hypothetical protein
MSENDAAQTGAGRSPIGTSPARFTPASGANASGQGGSGQGASGQGGSGKGADGKAGGSGPAPGGAPPLEQTFFQRRELDAILNIYGHMVAKGEWRDYAIGATKDVAVFAVYRRASEMPLYRIEKRPKLARRQGAYAVIAAGGQILKRGHDLKQVLTVFNRKRFQVVT